MKLRFTPKIIKNLEEKKQHLHLQGSQPRDAPYQLMCLLLVDSPARPTHNKTHAECNNSVKAHEFNVHKMYSYTNIQNGLKNESNERPHFIAERKVLCCCFPATEISFVSIFVISISVLTAITHHMACGMFSPSDSQVKLFHHGMRATKTIIYIFQILLPFYFKAHF